MEKQEKHPISQKEMCEEAPLCGKDKKFRELLLELRASRTEVELQNEELRTAQEKLLQSRDKYIDLFDFAPVGYVSLSEKGTILEVNLTFANLLGRKLKTLLNKKLNTYIFPEHQDVFFHHFRKVIETKKSQSCQLQLQGKDKKFIWVNMSSANISGSSKSSPLRFIITNIEELKKAEDDLRKSEKRFQLAIDAASDGVFDQNLNTGEIYHSGNWSQILGYSPKDIKEGDITWGKLIHPEDEKKTFVVQQHLDGHEPSYRTEFRMMQKNGHWKWLQARGRVVEWDKKNRPLRFVGVHTDITQQKIIEENLRASEQRFRSLSELSPVGVHLTDHKGDCTFANKYWREMCGLSLEEAKGQGWLKAVHPDDLKHVSEAWQKLVTLGENLAIEYRLLSPSGQTPWVYSLTNSIPDAQGYCTGYIGITIDISIKKRAEIEAKMSLAKLETRVHKKTLELRERSRELEKQVKIRSHLEQELRRSETNLEKEKLNSEEVNTTLRVLLKRRDEEKKQLARKIQINVSQTILPLLEEIKNASLSESQKVHFDCLESSLRKITSPFLQNISSMNLRLTPMEIKVAHLVREGKTSKEIAAIFNLSVDTINIHRKKIRKKCGICGKKNNLRTTLMSFDSQDLIPEHRTQPAG